MPNSSKGIPYPTDLSLVMNGADDIAAAVLAIDPMIPGPVHETGDAGYVIAAGSGGWTIASSRVRVVELGTGADSAKMVDVRISATKITASATASAAGDFVTDSEFAVLPAALRPTETIPIMIRVLTQPPCAGFMSGTTGICAIAEGDPSMVIPIGRSIQAQACYIIHS